MTICERLVVLRKSLTPKMTQTEFAKAIGMEYGRYKNYEYGTIPDEPTIRLICMTFHINQRWLETGEGPMKEQRTVLLADQVRAILQGSYTEEQIALVVSVLKMPPEFFSAWVNAFDSEMEAIKKDRG